MSKTKKEGERSTYKLRKKIKTERQGREMRQRDNYKATERMTNTKVREQI